MNSNEFDPVEEVCGRIGFAKSLYTADLGAMDHELLEKQCGGKARCGYDLTYELAGMYTLMATLLEARSGEISGPQGWVVAPAEFKSKEIALPEFVKGIDAFSSAFQNYQGNILTDTYASPVGPFTPLAMANLAVWHTMYHSGQLNFIQTLSGDDGFHWMP